MPDDITPTEESSAAAAAPEPAAPEATAESNQATTPKGFDLKNWLQNLVGAFSGGGDKKKWTKVIMVSVFVIVFMGLSTTMVWGMALWALARATAEPSGSYASSGGECYMPDQYWQDPVTGLDVASAKSKIESLKNANPSEDKIKKAIEETRSKGYNPAVSLAVWGKESTYGTDPNNRKDPKTGLPYEFGYLHEGTGGFDGQLQGAISTFDKAYKKEDPYKPSEPGQPIQVYWINTYTPQSDPANAGDRKTFFTILKQVVPEQIICNEGGSSEDKKGPFIQKIQNSWLAKTHRFYGKMTVRGVVLHYTAGGNVEGAISAMSHNETYVHVIIDREGKVYQLLPLNLAPKSGSGDGNRFAVGIEIVGMNEQELLANKKQFDAVVSTVKWLITNYNIPNVRGNTENLSNRRGIFGHYQTQGPWSSSQRGCNSPNKDDPGRTYMKKVWDTLGSSGTGC